MFASATVMISMGAVSIRCMRKATYVYIDICTYTYIHTYIHTYTVEVAFYSVNQMIIIDILGASDVGGSITIHLFGAYFGLALAATLRCIYVCVCMYIHIYIYIHIYLCIHIYIYIYVYISVCVKSRCTYVYV
jgi:hypothetical protein